MTPYAMPSLFCSIYFILVSDAFGWLYACRGLYQLQEYGLVVEGLSHCLRHEKTAKESQHLLAFSLLHTRQNKLAAAAFCKSIRLGNDTDWQPLVELLLEQPKLKLSGAATAVVQNASNEAFQ
jgi:hypothetical protein